MNFFYTIVLVCSFFIKGLSAEDSVMSLALYPIVDESIPKFFQSKITKSILRASAKESGFYLVIASDKVSSEKATSDLRLNVEVNKTSKGYFIVADLISVKIKTRLIRVRKERIPSASLLRTIEAAIDLIFKQYPKLSKDKDKDKRINDSDRRKEENKKKKVKNRNNQEGFKRSASYQEIKYKASIVDLKKKVNEVVEEIEKKSKVKIEEREAVEKKNRLALGLLEAGDNKSDKPLNILNKKYSQIGFNIFSESNTSQGSLLGVSYDANYIGIEYEGGRTIFNSDWRLTYLFSYATVFSDVDLNLTDYQAFATGIKKPVFNDKFFAASWLSYETLGFVNLPEATRGLQSSLNNILWLDIEGQVGFYLDQIAILFRMGYGTSLLSQSDFKPIRDEGLSGSRIKLGVVVSGLMKKIDIMFRFHSRNLNSDNIIVNSDLFQGQIIYAF